MGGAEEKPLPSAVVGQYEVTKRRPMLDSSMGRGRRVKGNRVQVQPVEQSHGEFPKQREQFITGL